MPAREGFLTADIGVLFWHHRRLRKLRADLGRDEGTIVGAIYNELILASWAEGDRLELGELDTPADLTDVRIESLKAAGLVDAQGRLPAKTWAEWFGAAADRRAERKASGSRGAAKRWSANSSANGSANSSASGQPMAQPIPVRPSVRPSGTDETEGRTTPRVPARASGAPARAPVSTAEAPVRRFGSPSRAAAVAAFCEHVDEHRPDYQWFSDQWRCMVCEQVRAAADPLTFREKVARAADRAAERDEPEGLF